MDRTSRRAARRKASTSVSAPATTPELVALLEDIRKIDPGAKFTGLGRYVSLVGSRDWTPKEHKQVEAIFVVHRWKVKFDL